MDPTQEQLQYVQKCTMRRIYGIWFARRVMPFLAIELVVLGAIIICAQSRMSFHNIAANIQSRVTQHSVIFLWGYTIETLRNADFIAILVLIGIAGAGMFIVRDALRVARRFRGNFLRFGRVI
jgi:hypothetical protein